MKLKDSIKQFLIVLIVILCAIVNLAPVDVPPEDASEINTDTSSFNTNLSATEDNVQKALDVLDDVTAGHGDGANCNAGEYPLGIDGSGAVQNCTDATTEIDTAIATKDECSEISGCVPNAYDALVDFTGTLTDGKICTYDLAGGEIDCNYTDDAGTDNQSLFQTIDAPQGTDPVADTAADTLQLLEGSTKVDITGDATADSITIDVDQTQIDHDQLLNFDASEHFLQTAITNVSTALSTGLLKVTNPTGALSSITDSSTNWDTAYTHSQDNTQAHSDYLLNTSDQMDGDLIIDNTSTEAVLVRKNADAADVFIVDTTNKKVYIYGGGGSNQPTFDFWGNWMLVGSEYNQPLRRDIDQWGGETYKFFKMQMTGINSTTKPTWSVLTSVSNPTSNTNDIILGGEKGPQSITFSTSPDVGTNVTARLKVYPTGGVGQGAVGNMVPSGFTQLNGGSLFAVDQVGGASLGAEMITNAVDRQVDVGHNWVFTGNWSRSATLGNPTGCLYYSTAYGTATHTATLPNSAIGGGGLKKDKWYKLSINIYVDNWNGFGPYVSNVTAPEWTQFTYDSSSWNTITRYFTPTADNVNLVFSWFVAGKTDQVRIDNLSLKEVTGGNIVAGGALVGNSAKIWTSAGISFYVDSAGTDADINIATIQVTGSPISFWDESEDAFSQNKGQRITDGAIAVAVETVATLGAGVTTFAVDSNVCIITGDAGGNTVATITGGKAGQILTLLFTDALVTITDTNDGAANTVDLSAAFTSADDTTLTLVYDGTLWREVARSVN